MSVSRNQYYDAFSELEDYATVHHMCLVDAFFHGAATTKEGGVIIHSGFFPTNDILDIKDIAVRAQRIANRKQQEQQQ